MHRYTIEVNGKTYMLDVRELSPQTFEVVYDEQLFAVILRGDCEPPKVEFTSTSAKSSGDPAPQPSPSAETVRSVTVPPREKQMLNAPMPGVIISVEVKTGDKVKRGDVLAKLEAMKMVNPICSPKETVIAEILVSEGTTVAYGQTLMTFRE